jgi:sugar phosphate isomerase/epimerase
MNYNRRKFIQNSLATSIGIPLLAQNIWANSLPNNQDIKISLQCFSFAGKLLNGKMDILDFPKQVRENFNLSAAEYWNVPLMQKRKDPKFIQELNKRTADYGLENTIMLVDLFDVETRVSKSICDLNPKKRLEAIEEHKEWLEVAKSIGCNSIRVNLWSEGMTATEVKDISEESLNALLEYSSSLDLSIVIENHGGFTSDASWLVDLIRRINHPNLGTLPDFGSLNFCLEKASSNDKGVFNTECVKYYDKYKGVEEMLPFAKGISAKATHFDSNGEELSTDFKKMLDLIKLSSFKGYIAIEYEGSIMEMYGKNPSDFLPSNEGIVATKDLIEKYL